MTDNELEVRLAKIEQDIAELKEAYQDLASAVSPAASLLDTLQQQIADLSTALAQLQTKVDKYAVITDGHTTKITALEESALSGQFADGELLLSNFVKESTENTENGESE